mgnify:CR=1 FL=1
MKKLPVINEKDRSNFYGPNYLHCVPYGLTRHFKWKYATFLYLGWLFLYICSIT